MLPRSRCALIWAPSSLATNASDCPRAVFVYQPRYASDPAERQIPVARRAIGSPCSAARAPALPKECPERPIVDDFTAVMTHGSSLTETERAITRRRRLPLRSV